MTAKDAECLLGLLTRWADARPDISCLALVGSWAATDPMDEGTRRVASDGLRILLDREGRLARLSAAIG